VVVRILRRGSIQGVLHGGSVKLLQLIRDEFGGVYVQRERAAHGEDEGVSSACKAFVPRQPFARDVARGGITAVLM
jgi:hypothetical protein